MELGLKNYKIEFFSSIKDLPFDRFQEFNRFSMLDTEIGSTMDDFDKVVVRINEFIQKDLKDDSVRELINLRTIVNHVLSGTNHRGLAFVCLIKKLNGKEVTDYGEENLKKILKKLSDAGLTVGDVIDKGGEVKKKIETELELFFPSMFDNILQKEGRTQMKARLMALCDMIIEDDKAAAAKKLFDIELAMLRLVKPKNFMGKNSYEIQFEKNYQMVVCNLSAHTNKDINKMTVLEVYTLMEILQKKNTENG